MRGEDGTRAPERRLSRLLEGRRERGVLALVGRNGRLGRVGGAVEETCVWLTVGGRECAGKVLGEWGSQCPASAQGVAFVATCVEECEVGEVWYSVRDDAWKKGGENEGGRERNSQEDAQKDSPRALASTDLISFCEDTSRPLAVGS